MYFELFVVIYVFRSIKLVYIVVISSISYNMGTGHKYQAKHEFPCFNYVTLLALLKSAQTLIATAHSTYILKDAHCDCGILL